MDLNVCPACGEWSDDFVVAAEEAVLVCPACGQRRPFARLPLFALTGPSGAGKSAVAAILAGRLQQCVVLEQDLLWLPDQLDPADTPPMQLLDTTGRSVQDSAAGVRAWVLRQLVASP